MTAPYILSPTYQSHTIAFPDWVSIFTLALAPLIAHIAAGVPQPSYLCTQRPRWHDRICLYNPTSIIWRYGMIADRRIRARSWDRRSIAASNALFWTPRGWDGSEAMVDVCSPYCTHLPEYTHISLISREMIKTVIVTLQGLQALIPLIRGLGTTRASDSFVHWVGADNIFFTLSILGLLRLNCALWTTDDFSFHSPQNTKLDHFPVEGAEVFRGYSLDSLQLEGAQSSVQIWDRFKPTTFWASRIFRAMYILPVLGMSMTVVLYMTPWTKSRSDTYANTFTTSTFLLIIFSLVLTSVTVLVCAYYFVRGHTTTVVPCISSPWYKTYTVMLWGFGILLFILVCIETKRTPCGKYTSGPGEAADIDACLAKDSSIIFVAPDGPEFGLASRIPSSSQDNRSSEYWVQGFQGTCLGVKSRDFSQQVKVLGGSEGQGNRRLSIV